MFGRNSCGGVHVSDMLPNAERAELVARVCEIVRGIRDPRDGREVALWARPRSEVVDGRYAERLPDDLFQLRPEYGVDFGLFGRLIRSDPLHRRISGGHRPNGVFGATTRALPAVPTGLAQLHDLVVKLVLEDSV
jgi:hypothetical protein